MSPSVEDEVFGELSARRSGLMFKLLGVLWFLQCAISLLRTEWPFLPLAALQALTGVVTIVVGLLTPRRTVRLATDGIHVMRRLRRPFVAYADVVAVETDTAACGSRRRPSW